MNIPSISWWNPLLQPTPEQLVAAQCRRWGIAHEAAKKKEAAEATWMAGTLPYSYHGYVIDAGCVTSGEIMINH